MNMKMPKPPVIDIHTHAFPDAVAARAIPKLAAEADVKTALDGTLDALLGSMDEAGIDRSVVLSIATRPEQFDAILAWSRAIRSPRIIPFPSVHPADPRALERLDLVAEEGFQGIKLHPYYQDFMIDESRMLPLYERCIRHGLFVLCHTGYDIAFPRDPIASPERIVRLVDLLPELRLVTSHFGAWEDWDEVRSRMVGRPIYMDVSYSMNDSSRMEAFRDILNRHPKEYLLFGSDSPWESQHETLRQIRALVTAPDILEAILGGNAARLFRDEPLPA